MMIQKVVQNPDPVLHKEAEKILDFHDPKLKKLIRNMQDALREQDGLGLAAPQIGVSKSVFVIPQEYAPEVHTWRIPYSFVKPLHPTIYINPRIKIFSTKKDEMEEGCLSVRGVYHPLTRAHTVTIEAKTERGQKFTVRAEGLLARIFQHETDHLNGILFLERLHEK